MPNREWFADDIQIYEDGEEEYFVDDIQINEDQEAVLADGRVMGGLVYRGGLAGVGGLAGIGGGLAR